MNNISFNSYNMQKILLVTQFNKIKLLFENMLQDAYNWKFPQRTDTMYLSTIQQPSIFPKINPRQSSFKLRDIQGSIPKQQQFCRVNQPNKIINVQPNPQVYKSHRKISSNLQTNDIEGATPSTRGFTTNRVVNPLNPQYHLPTPSPVTHISQPQLYIQPQKFLRNTLDISDIIKKKPLRKQIKKGEQFNGKRQSRILNRKQQLSSLNVKDINNQNKYSSQRKNNPSNPLNPIYQWRDCVQFSKIQQFSKLKQVNNYKQLNKLDEQFRSLNSFYGNILGTTSKKLIPSQTHKKSSLDIKDIEGSHANSINQHRYFIDKRMQFRNYMSTSDIQKSCANSLKKGITTKRNINPIMPVYQLPS